MAGIDCGLFATTSVKFNILHKSPILSRIDKLALEVFMDYSTEAHEILAERIEQLVLQEIIRGDLDRLYSDLFEVGELKYSMECLNGLTTCYARKILKSTPLPDQLFTFDQNILSAVPEAYACAVDGVIIQVLLDEMSTDNRADGIIQILTILNISDRSSIDIYDRLKEKAFGIAPELFAQLDKWMVWKHVKDRSCALELALECASGYYPETYPEILWAAIGPIARLRNVTVFVSARELLFSQSAQQIERLEQLLMPEKRAESIFPIILPMLFLNFEGAAVDDMVRLSEVRDLLKKHARALKDKTGALTHALQTLSIAFQDAVEPSYGLRQVHFALQQVDVLAALSNLTLLLETEEHTKLCVPWSKDEMFVAMDFVWQKVWGFSPSLIRDFDRLYKQTFGRLRIPRALETYMTNLPKMPDALNRFVLSVLHGEYKNERYNTDCSIHLHQLATLAPKVYAKWQLSKPSELLPFTRHGKPLFIRNTDEYEDLLLSGTEASATCQSIYAAGAYKKALLGFVMDGKYRMLAVQDESGKTIGRSMLRLLIDDKEEVALFLEIYYGEDSELIKQAIFKKAAELSAWLGVDLYAGEPQENSFRQTEKTLTSLSSPVPYEYVDALAGIENEKYTLYTLYQLPTLPVHHDQISLQKFLSKAGPILYTEDLHKTGYYLNQKLQKDVWGAACRSYIRMTADSFSYNGERARGLITKPHKLLELLKLGFCALETSDIN